MGFNLAFKGLNWLEVCLNAECTLRDVLQSPRTHLASLCIYSTTFCRS